jgi:hypothetical protein
VFTARYALRPYIKQIRFVFKGLNRRLVEPQWVWTVLERREFLVLTAIPTPLFLLLSLLL